jgi:hypothetical protein
MYAPPTYSFSADGRERRKRELEQAKRGREVQQFVDRLNARASRTKSSDGGAPQVNEEERQKMMNAVRTRMQMLRQRRKTTGNQPNATAEAADNVQRTSDN